MQGHDGLHFGRATEHTAFELEVFKTIARLRGLGQAHHGLGGQGFFMAQALPVVVGIRFAEVGQVGFAPVAQIKQVAQHLYPIALLAVTQQGCHRHAQKLAEQIEQSAFHRRHRMDGHPQVKGLVAAPALVQAGKALAQAVEQTVPVADRSAFDQAPRGL